MAAGADGETVRPPRLVVVTKPSSIDIRPPSRDVALSRHDFEAPP
jgi:hypothetical protein